MRKQKMNDEHESAEIPKRIKSLGSILGHRYTVADGLAGMQVEDIYQDRRGLSVDCHGRRRGQPVRWDSFRDL